MEAETMLKTKNHNNNMHKNGQTYREKRHVYIQKYKPELFKCLVQENQLVKHLALIQQSAENREKQIVLNMLEKDPPIKWDCSEESYDQHFERLIEQARQIVEIEIIRS